MGNDQEAARGWMGAGEDGDGIAFHSPAEVCLAPAAAMRTYLPAVAPHVHDARADPRLVELVDQVLQNVACRSGRAKCRRGVAKCDVSG